MPTIVQMLGMGVAFGAAAGAAFASFIAVRSILTWLGMVFKLKCEAKVLKSIGVELPENGGDFQQPDVNYQRQDWRK